MEDLKYKRETILEKLKTNRDTHEQDYKEAVEGYNEQVVTGLTEALKLAKKGEKYKTSLSLREPVNHLKDYDRVIAMLTTSHQEEITMTQTEFNNYVCDNWSWSGEFEMTKAAYSRSLSR